MSDSNYNKDFSKAVEDSQRILINNLIEKRIEMNLTQSDITKMTGMTQQAVSRIERCENFPTLSKLIRYLCALNLDINSIFE